jgi:hypothetical protein
MNFLLWSIQKENFDDCYEFVSKIFDTKLYFKLYFKTVQLFNFLAQTFFSMNKVD